jgi:hypothetical protein
LESAQFVAVAFPAGPQVVAPVVETATKPLTPAGTEAAVRAASAVATLAMQPVFLRTRRTPSRKQLLSSTARTSRTRSRGCQVSDPSHIIRHP